MTRVSVPCAEAGEGVVVSGSTVSGAPGAASAPSIRMTSVSADGGGAAGTACVAAAGRAPGAAAPARASPPQARSTQATIGRLAILKDPGSRRLSSGGRWRTPASGTTGFLGSDRHVLHLQIPNQALEQIGFIRGQVALGFLAKRLQQVDHLLRAFEIDLDLAGQRMPCRAQVGGRLAREIDDEVLEVRRRHR